MSWTDIQEEIEKFLFERGQDLEGIENVLTGEYTRSLKALIDIWEIDCGGNWVLYLKTALVGAFEGLWIILTPSFEEILENYLEPKAGRRGGRRGQRNERHPRPGPGGTRRVGFRGGIPDVDQAIASRIPGREALAMRKIGPGEAIIWKQINAADRVAWYWILLSATSESVVTWQSGLMQSGECKAPNDGSFTLTTPVRDSFINTDLWFNAVLLPDKYQENAFITNNGIVQHQITGAIADWFATAEHHWQITNPSALGPIEGTLIVTILGVVGGSGFAEVARLEEEFTVAPSSGFFLQQDIAGTVQGASDLHFYVDLTVTVAPGPFEVAHYARAAGAYRNSRFA